MDKPTVFLSYNNKSESYVNSLHNRLRDFAEVIRYTNQDHTGVGTWKSFRKFMETIRKQDYAVLVVSKAYLESEACLFEVMELWKDKDLWDDKVMYIVMDDAHIYTPEGRLEYVDFWQNKCDVYNSKVSKIKLENAGDISKQIAKYRWIANNIYEFLGKVADSNNPSVEDAFSEILKKIMDDNDNRLSPGIINEKRDYVEVYTKDGSMCRIMRGATVLDLAFCIHRDLGLHFSYATLNGRKKHMPANTILSEGDRVIIVPDEAVSPSLSWFKYVKTDFAKKALVKYFNYNFPNG